ncbi:MAG TPA: cupin domain-containing protein [Reyranella sp.]|nr:cupin domain-containing protein [Reyranella sp.]
MTDATKWRPGVTVVRAEAQEAARLGPGGTGRATVVDYAGTGGQQTWIGTVTLQPKAKTGTHHHGRHEVTIYVVKGRSEIRWGERLEFAADVGPGDFVYFAPYVPHQELNPDERETVDFVVVRSDNEKIVVALDDKPVEQPERPY